MSLNKFYSLEKLATILVEERKKNKKIALANGGFDLVHIGHVRYLQGAKETADILVVALNSDKSLQRLKGDHRAILDEQSRIRIIAAFECVDYVTIFAEQTVDHVLQALKPDIHCKGSDYTVDTVPERETVKSYGGTVAIVGGAKVRSTSHIIVDIKNRSS